LQDENAQLKNPGQDLAHALESLYQHQEELHSKNETLKAVQSELQSSRARYQVLFDFAPVAYLSLDSKAVIKAANITAGILLQNEGKSLIRTSFYNYLEQLEQLRFKQFLQQVFQSKGLHTIELNLRLQQETNMAVSLHGRLFHPANHNSRVCFLALSDISARKQVEIALRDSEARFRSLVENVNAIAWTYSLIQNRFTYVSPHAENMLGYSINAWQSLDFWARHAHPDDQETALNFARQQIAAGQDHEFEYRMRTANGEYIWLRDIVKVHKNAQGQVASLSGFMVDVSKLKKTETELRQATAEAESDNRAKSAFLANMSHELRTPLNAILGYTQLLRRNPLVMPDIREQIQIIQHSGEHLLQLINNVLDLSKIEAERLELLKTEVYLPGFMQDLVQIFNLRAEQKQLTFQVEPPPYQESFHVHRLPMLIKTDEKRLRQVLFNLLNNAFKFTDYGTINLHMHWHEGLLHFSVQDTGRGIEKHDLKVIFEPFRQVGTQQYIEGSGLGLSISRHLVEMMGGHLEVESLIGQGSCFRFFIQAPVL